MEPQPLLSWKSAASLRPIERPVTRKALVLLMVTVHEFPVVPTGWLVKGIFVGEMSIVGVFEVPVPLSVTVCVPDGVALSVMTIAPLRLPTLCGENATVRLQVLLGPRVEPQPLLSTKSVGSVRTMLLILSRKALVLLTVTVHELPVVPTGWLENGMFVGVTKTVGELDVEVPDSEMVCEPWMALSKIVSVPLKDPVVSGENEI